MGVVWGPVRWAAHRRAVVVVHMVDDILGVVVVCVGVVCVVVGTAVVVVEVRLVVAAGVAEAAGIDEDHHRLVPAGVVIGGVVRVCVVRMVRDRSNPRRAAA